MDDNAGISDARDCYHKVIPFYEYVGRPRVRPGHRPLRQGWHHPFFGVRR
jgi:hypothetical protein